MSHNYDFISELGLFNLIFVTFGFIIMTFHLKLMIYYGNIFLILKI